MIAWLLVVAAAAEEPTVSLDFGGDLKSFFLAAFPYDHPLMPADPWGQGIVSARVRADLRATEHLRVQVHHDLAALAPAGSAGFGVASSGVAAQAPEAVDLSWSVGEGEDLAVRGRLDRALATVTLPHLDLTVGRQPITFGNGLFFTPLDLVNPFHPAVIDQEYKPGVDAVRLDVTRGVATRATLAAAYAGSWDREGLVAAAYGQSTVGVTDLGAFFGMVHADLVLGATMVSAVGPVGIHADAAVTLPDHGEVFVRAVAGAMWRPAERWTLFGELYAQTLGASDPDDYLTQATDPRYRRGELWALGRFYAGASARFELTPLVTLSGAALANLEDGSLLLLPSIGWSVAGNAELSAGAFFGVGRRPEAPLEVRSEFGLAPTTGFLRTAVYF